MNEVGWQNYEEVATYLLNQFAQHFGIFHVEGKQHVSGDTGINWEIDAKALRANGQGFLVVECRQHTTSGLKQEDLAAIAFRIQDVGALGGIVVTPLRLQQGAEVIAKARNIKSVILSADSTKFGYWLRFSKSVFEVQNIIGMGIGARIGPPAALPSKDEPHDQPVKDNGKIK